MCDMILNRHRIYPGLLGYKWPRRVTVDNCKQDSDEVALVVLKQKSEDIPSAENSVGRVGIGVCLNRVPLR